MGDKFWQDLEAGREGYPSRTSIPTTAHQMGVEERNRAEEAKAKARNAGPPLPVRLGDVIRTFAFFGAIAGVAYVYFKLNGRGWPELTGGVLGGAICGAIIGFPAYGVLIVIEFALKIVGIVLQIVAKILSVALLLGAIYLVLRLLGKA